MKRLLTISIAIFAVTAAACNMAQNGNTFAGGDGGEVDLTDLTASPATVVYDPDVEVEVESVKSFLLSKPHFRADLPEMETYSLVMVEDEDSARITTCGDAELTMECIDSDARIEQLSCGFVVENAALKIEVSLNESRDSLSAIKIDLRGIDISKIPDPRRFVYGDDSDSTDDAMDDAADSATDNASHTLSGVVMVSPEVVGGAAAFGKQYADASDDDTSDGSDATEADVSRGEVLSVLRSNEDGAPWEGLASPACYGWICDEMQDALVYQVRIIEHYGLKAELLVMNGTHVSDGNLIGLGRYEFNIEGAGLVVHAKRGDAGVDVVFHVDIDSRTVTLTELR